MNQKTAGATYRSYTAPVSIVNVSAGSDTAVLPNGTVGFFAIDFTPVTFSGSQYSLYLSKDGFSSIDAGDVKYAGVFNVIDLSATYPKTVQTGSASNNGTFLAGLVDGQKVLQGPIPVQISSDYKYIKVFDGSTTAVAVSLATVNILPGIQVTPSSGSAGVQVSVSGGGFPSAASIAINYTYSFVNWAGTSKTTHNGTWISSGITNNGGWFSKTAAMVDTKQAYNPLNGTIPTTDITFTAVNASKLSQAFTSGPGDAMFTSSNRVFDQVFSYFSGSTVDYANSGSYGNDSGSGTVVPTLDVHITGSLGIEGNYTNAASTVTVTIGATTATVTSDATSGHYIINVTVPQLPLGTNTVKVSDNGVTYMFTINVLPTLILTPASGPVNTVVTATAYGFPSNVWVSLWWQGLTYGDGNSYYLGNWTIGTSGSFNVTVTFTVPHTYGGAHDIEATTDTWASPVTESSLEGGAGYVTEATFSITPQLFVTPSTVSNDGSMILVNGTGFYPANSGNCQDSFDHCEYQVNVDNQYSAMSSQPYFTAGVAAAPNGDMNFTLIAAGFRPGLHVVSLMGPSGPCVTYSSCASVVPAVPAAFALFNVTTAGDPIYGAIQGISTSVSTAVNTALSGFSAQLTTITNDVSGLNGQLTSISSAISSLTTTVNGISSTVSSINTAVGQLASSMSSLSSVPSTLSSIQSTLNTAATNAQNAANSAQSAATAANNAVSGNSTSQTYVLVVAVLAAITLVLELAILVRKLS